VIVGGALGLIEPAAWRALAQTGRSQVMIAVVTFAGVVIFGVLQALLVAVALSIVDVVARCAKPHDAVLGYVDQLGRYAVVTFHPSARVTPGTRDRFTNPRLEMPGVREGQSAVEAVDERLLRRTRSSEPAEIGTVHMYPTVDAAVGAFTAEQ